MNRIDINLLKSIDTDTIDQQVKKFGEDAAAIHNTGIERDGGITNLYRTEVVSTTDTIDYTNDGQKITTTITGETRNIFINDKKIGEVDARGIEFKLEIEGTEDVVLDSAGNYITLNYAEKVITVTQYDTNNIILQSRDILFNDIGDDDVATSISFIHRDNMDFDTEYEFIFRSGNTAYLLREAGKNPEEDVITLRSSEYYSAAVYEGAVVVVDDTGLSSWDGTAWKYADGTGAGTGLYSNDVRTQGEDVIIRSDGGFLIVEKTQGTGLGIHSYDGTNWKWGDGTGTGTGPYYFSNDVRRIVKYGDQWVGYQIYPDGVANWDPVGGWTKGNGGGAGLQPYALINNVDKVVADNDSNMLYVEGEPAGSNYSGLYSFDGTAWKNPDGTGTGTGPYWFGPQYTTTKDMIMHKGTLVISASYYKSSTENGFRVLSWDGTAWKYYDGTGTGTGPYYNYIINDNDSPIERYQFFLNFNNGTSEQLLMYQDQNIKISSWDGTAWKFFDGTGAGTGIHFDLSTSYVVENISLALLNFNNDIFSLGAHSTSYYKGVDEYWYQLFNDQRVILQTSSSSGFSGIFFTHGWNGMLVYGTSGGIFSYDGANWKWPDGSGSGTGPYSSYILSCRRAVSYSGDLIVSSEGGISSYDGTNWKYYDGTGTGTGLHYTQDDLSQTTQQSLAGLLVIPGNRLVFLGFLGDVSTYKDGILYKYDGTNSGPGTNAPFGQSVIPNSSWPVSIKWRDQDNTLLLTGRNGLDSTWDLASGGNDPVNGWAWTLGDGTYINDGKAEWLHFKGDNGIDSIVPMDDISGTVVFLQDDGVFSYDGANWKYADGTGTGTGPYGTKADIGTTGNLSKAVKLNNKVVVFTYNDAYVSNGGNSWTAIGNKTVEYSSVDVIENKIHATIYGQFLAYVTVDEEGIYRNETYLDEALRINIPIKSNELNSVYCYKYENGKYILGVPGNSRQLYSSLDQGFNIVEDINCEWAIPQTYSGFTRHVLTNTANADTITSTELNNLGHIGYVDFNTNFSDKVIWSNNGGMDITALLHENSISGYGYVEAIFKDASADIYTSYSPLFNSSSSNAILLKSQTDTNISAYGKLTNGPGTTAANNLEFRNNFISSVQGYLSVGIIDGSGDDNVGTLISDVGQFDPGWTPYFDDDKIIYRYKGKYYYVKIGTDIGNIIQSVDDRVLKINTIHPLNLIDTVEEELEVGSIDFNGRTLYTSTGSVATTKTALASRFSGDFSNSIDVGSKLIAIDGFNASNFELVGVGIPNVTNILSNYIIDTFYDNSYFVSTLSDGSEVIDATKLNTIYLEDESLPPSLGAIYNDGVAVSGSNTVVLDDGKDVYMLANTLSGEYKFFELYGQLYAFDGLYIYLISKTNGTISTPVKTAVATGLEYIATTPIETYFKSKFDNSLFIFSGGRNLSKAKRFSKVDKLKDGVYSVMENTLWLDTEGDRVYTTRDSIISEIVKPDESILNTYNTVNGILFKVKPTGGVDTVYNYNFSNEGEVVPLKYQTAYYGLGTNSKSILKEYVVAIYNELKENISVKLSVSSFDEQSYDSVDKLFNLSAKDYDRNGYATIRIQPGNAKALGSSLTIESENKIVISSVSAEFAQAGKGTISTQRSR
jgi:hypothetical protein